MRPPQRYVLTAFLTFLAGAGIAVAGMHELKWLAVLVLLCCIPAGAVLAGSMRTFLALAMVWSLSTQMCVWLLNTGSAPDQLGFRVSFTGLCAWGWLAAGFFSDRSSGPSGPRPAFSSTAFWSMVFLVFWAALSLMTSHEPAKGISFFTAALDAFAVFLCGIFMAQTREGRERIVQTTALTVIGTSLIAFAQFVKPGSLNFSFMGSFLEPLRLRIGGHEFVRPSAFLGHANSMAMYMASWAPLLIVHFFAHDEGSKTGRWLLLASFLSAAAAAGIAFSRGGWVAFVIAAGLALASLRHPVVRHFYPDGIRKARLLLLGALIAVSVLSPFIYGRLTGDDLGAGESRLQLASFTMRTIREHPLTGLGYANFFGVQHLNIETTPPHNIYLHTAAELGLPGLLALLVFMFGVLRSSWRSIRSEEHSIQGARSVIWEAGLAAGFAAVCLHGLLEPGTIGYPRLLSLFFIGGLLLAHLTEGNERVPAR